MALTGLTKVQKIGINSTTIPTFGGSRNTGVVTATTFVGDGSGLSGVTGSGAGVIVRDGGSLVGTAGTINFGTNLNVSAISAGIVTVTNAVSASALNNLSDVTISSASNGQILKHNGSVFVNTAETTYSQSSVASGSNVNLRLTDSGGTNDDILITAGSNITFSSVSAGGFTIAASGGGGGGGLSNVVEDTTPELGGNLNLNNKFISGSGGINVSGVTTSTQFVGNLTGNVTGNVTGNADTATHAINFTVTANNTANETVYPIFVDGRTGNQGAETDTGLTYNPSTNLLTAGSFSGSGANLTGVVTSIVAGSNISLAGGPTGIVTISSSGGGGLSLSNGTNNNVVTASSATALNGEGNLTFDGTTLALTGNQTASGSIVVGSGVTIDARGINAVGKGVTAGSFNALSGSFNVQIGSLNQGFYLNNGNTTHLGLSWSSSASIYQFRGNSGGNYAIVIDDFSTISLSPKSGAVNLNFAENNKFSTTSGGISVTGIATATGFSGPLTGNVTGNVTGNADTATAATRVTLTNQAGDSSCNVLFAQSATGNQLPHTNANLTFNSSSGALTAGSFVKSGGSSSQFLKADGSVDSNTYLTSGSYLENVSEDSTPELGGNLNLNSKNITGTGNAQIVGVITATSAVPTWTLGASGTDHYTFTGNGFTSATNDPDIYLVRGQRYAFLNNSGGNHPFQIQSDANSTAYNTGVTRNNATSGYITFNVPMSAPAHLYYKCSNHPNMLGNIYVVGQHLANGVDNRVVTASSAYGMNGEANLRFDGSLLTVAGKITCDVNSDIDMDNSANGQLQIGGNGYTSAIALNDEGMQIYHNSSSRGIIFGINESEKVRITSGGNLRLGLDSVAEQTDSAHYIMTLTGKSGQTGAGAIAFKDPSANTDAFIFADGGNLFITADYSNATADSSIRFRVDGSNERLRIDDSGNLFLRSATANYLVMGSNGDATDSGVTNNMNWIRGNGANTQYNTSGGFHAFEISGSEKFKIASSGQIGLSGSNYGTAGQVIRSTGNSSAPVWANPGRAIQYLTDYKTAEQNTSSSSWQTISGLAKTITPKNANSRFLLLFMATGQTNGGRISLDIAYSATGITDDRIGNALGEFALMSSEQTSGQNIPLHMHWVHHPNTTNAVTYTPQFRGSGSNTVIIGASNHPAHFTVIELEGF